MIRLYEDKDLFSCRELWFELTQYHRDIFNDSNIGGSDPQLFFDEHLKKVGRDNIYVYDNGEKILGFYGIIKRDEEIEIEPLVVLKDFRGMGIGKELLNHAVNKAKEECVRFICVKPIARNEDAIKFYYKQGFNTIGAIELLIDLNDKENTYWKSSLEILNKDFKY